MPCRYEFHLWKFEDVPPEQLGVLAGSEYASLKRVGVYAHSDLVALLGH